MIGKKAHSQFSYCVPWTFELAEDAIRKGIYRSRVCYVTTQGYRLYLSVSGRSVTFSPYVRKDNQWIAVKINSRVVLPSVLKLFRSPDTLERVLTETFFWQFPKAEESFYDSVPSLAEVEKVLATSPLGSVLTENYILFDLEENCGVEEADGIVSINVEEGVFMMPYDHSEVDGIPDIVFQVYRGKLHPDSKVSYANERAWDIVDSIVDKIRAFHWSDLRRHINSVIDNI